MKVRLYNDLKSTKVIVLMPFGIIHDGNTGAKLNNYTNTLIHFTTEIEYF